MNTPLTVVIAGSTVRTEQCLRAIADDSRFHIEWVITPVPRPVGRKQIITTNPVELYALEHHLPVVSVDKKLDSQVQGAVDAQVSTFGRPDLLLVVDFGYVVPDWLLQLPTIAPLNIHPSLLPRWRGSSPGQYCLLAGESQSAVSLMVMNAGLDEGPIIAQLPFTVGPYWTQQEYYQHSFEVMCGQLAELVFDFATGTITAHDQPAASPTPVARRLSKQDSFVSWAVISQAMNSQPTQTLDPNQLNECLAEVFTFLSASTHSSITTAQLLEQAHRGFSPWPQLWTVVQTPDGEKRMKIISCHVGNGRLVLDEVQLEGKNVTSWQAAATHIT